MATLSLKKPPVAEPAAASPVAQPTREDRPKRNPLDRLPPEVRKAAEWIKETWPNAFDSPRLPIAIGSGDIILSAKPEHIDARAVGRAMNFLMRDPEYVEALATDGAMRLDLSGVKADPVSEADRQSAAMDLHSRALRAAAKKG